MYIHRHTIHLYKRNKSAKRMRSFSEIVVDTIFVEKIPPYCLYHEKKQKVKRHVVFVSHPETRNTKKVHRVHIQLYMFRLQSIDFSSQKHEIACFFVIISCTP